MKYILVIGDGMADRPVEQLGGLTPLQKATTPHVDALAQTGRVGLVRTVPKGVPPGSDTAILSIFGYDPRTYYTGRSPLEAAGSGVKMRAGDVSYRCNLCAISEKPGEFLAQDMLSHSGGAISGEDAMVLMQDLLKDARFAALCTRLGLGLTINPSYRHVALMHDATAVETTPPHDILGQALISYLPDGAPDLIEVMQLSYDVLKHHPLNAQRRKQGLAPANCLWFWGGGGAVELSSFVDKYRHDGGVVTAVPLVWGIGNLAGLTPIVVEGATGEIDTNYHGKVEAALDVLKTHPFVALHVEAPDECGHAGDAPEKVRAIELIDSEVIAPLIEGLRQNGEPFRLLFLSDHPTPIITRTHDDAPVPYLIYDSRESEKSGLNYDEFSAQNGPMIEEGHTLMQILFEQ